MGRTASQPAGRVPGEVAGWSAYVGLGLGYTLVGPSLAALRTFLHASYGVLGVLFAAAGAGLIVSYVLSNRWVDRLGFRRVLAGGAAAYGLSLLILLFTRSVAVWAAAVAVGATVGGAVDVCAARLVSQAAAARRNGALNLLNVFFAVGALVAPLLVAAILAAGLPITWPFAAAGLWLIGSGVLAWLTMGSSPPAQPEGASLLRSVAWAVGEPWMRPLILAMVLYAGAEVGLSGWIAPYAHAVDGLPVVRAAAVPFLFWTAMVGGRALATARSRYWSEVAMLRGGAATAALGLGVLLVLRGPLPLIVGTALCGAGCAPVFPATFALAAGHAPGRQSASFGVLYPAAALGNLVLPYLAGQAFALGPPFALGVPLVSTLALGLTFTLGAFRGPGYGESR
jgi:fucose permease